MSAFARPNTNLDKGVGTFAADDPQISAELIGCVLIATEVGRTLELLQDIRIKCRTTSNTHMLIQGW